MKRALKRKGEDKGVWMASRGHRVIFVAAVLFVLLSYYEFGLVISLEISRQNCYVIFG